MFRPIATACCVVVLSLGSQAAYGQFSPVVWPQPAPIVWQQPAPVVWQQPAPVVWQQPSPVVVSRSLPTVAAPVMVAPTPVTRVYRPAMIGYKPVRTTYTRRRPILGGSVTRYRYGFQRVAF